METLSALQKRLTAEEAVETINHIFNVTREQDLKCVLAGELLLTYYSALHDFKVNQVKKNG